MTYNKTNWKTGDVITAKALNNLESGVSNNDTSVTELNEAKAVFTENITNLQNDKEDAFKAIQPLVKTRTEINPVVGFTNNIGGKAWDRATGSLELRNMSGAGYCLTDAYGNDAQVIDSKLILKKYILIPYTQGQIVRIPAKVSDSSAICAISLVNVDSNGNIDYISNYNAMNRQQPNLNAKGSAYTQSSQYIGAVTRISGAASTGGYSSVNVTSNLTDSILIQLRVTDTKSTYALSIGRLSRNGYSNAYTSTDINVINRLKDVNALLLTRIGSTSSFAGMGVSESAPYDLSLIQVFEDDGTTLETLTDPVGFVNSHTNIYDATKNIINNSLSLNIGSGLSVVDGKLTSTEGGNYLTEDSFTMLPDSAIIIPISAGTEYTPPSFGVILFDWLGPSEWGELSVKKTDGSSFPIFSYNRGDGGYFLPPPIYVTPTNTYVIGNNNTATKMTFMPLKGVI